MPPALNRTGRHLKHPRNWLLAVIVWLSVSCLDASTAPGDGGSSGSGGYSIDVRYIGNVPSSVKTAASSAASRWRSAITGDIEDIEVSIPAGKCVSGAPAVSETIDDILVYVAVVPSLSVPAAATICLIRSGSDLPVVAYIEIRESDVSKMASAGVTANVLLHEMGHAVGMSETLWTRQGLTNFSAPSNPVFTGTAAKAAFQSFKLGFPAGANVPLESSGGAGVFRTHWRGSVLGDEIMAPSVSYKSVLSTLTISALKDLGYRVNLGAATPYTGKAAVMDGPTLTWDLSGDLSTAEPAPAR